MRKHNISFKELTKKFEEFQNTDTFYNGYYDFFEKNKLTYYQIDLSKYVSNFYVHIKNGIVVLTLFDDDKDQVTYKPTTLNEDELGRLENILNARKKEIENIKHLLDTQKLRLLTKNKQREE